MIQTVALAAMAFAATFLIPEPNIPVKMATAMLWFSVGMTVAGTISH